MLPFPYQFPVTVLIAILTLVIYCGTNVKMFLTKRRLNRIQNLATPIIQPQNHLEQIESRTTWAQFFPYAKKMAWSSVDLITLYIPFILVTFDAILWNVYMKRLSLIEMKLSSYGHFYYVYHQFINPLLCLWSVAINTLVRKKNLRKCKVHKVNTGYLKKNKS